MFFYLQRAQVFHLDLLEKGGVRQLRYWQLRGLMKGDNGNLGIILMPMLSAGKLCEWLRVSNYEILAAG